MNDMHMTPWTIDLELPVIEMDSFEPLPPTVREPRPSSSPRLSSGYTMNEMLSPQLLSAAAFWFTEKDEAPTRIDGKIRVFGEPIKLTKRNKRKDATPKHADGPGPSLETVLTNLTHV